ncbi:MAG TPA: ABC transporter permease [Candidatus Saccharimonadia bacterium]|nr:ABC transporter permease [Candidatus Saccharimonadia bacterium]
MLNTVYILWLRQLKKYFRSRSRIIGSLAQPMLYLLAFGYGLGSVFAKAGQGSYIQFLAPGILLMSVLFTSVFSGIELIWDRQFGFLKETLVAPVSRFHIMLGRTLGGATVATIQGAIVFVLTLIVGFRPHNWGLVPVGLVFVFLVALMFTALGTLIATQLEDMQGFQLIINFLVMPVFFLSGAMFPLDNLPKAVEIISRIDPLTYGVDGLRSTFINITTIGVTTDLFILVVLTGVTLAIGGYLFDRIQV